MTQATIIHPDALPDVWMRVQQYVQEVCDRSEGKFLPTDVLQYFIKNRFQLWTVTDVDDLGSVLLHGIAITELVNYPRKKICHIIATTGENLDVLLPSITEIEEWAVKEGCASVDPIARAGYERVLKDRGYVKTHVVLTKDLPRA